jgi:proteasome beta subunit
MDEPKIQKTGTTTLGMICKDGIILAADKKATLGWMVSNKDMEKVIIINEDLAVTVAGTVSDIQLLIKLIRAQIKLDELRRGKKIKVKEAANLLGNLVYNNIRKFSSIQGITGFLLGGRDDEGYYLYEVGVDGSVIQSKNYVSDGSGMMFAIGVLEANYQENIDIEEGIKLAIKAVSAAAQRDTASGCGVDVITITKDGAKKTFSKIIDTRFTS